MIYTILGKTGLIASRLGFGTMRLPIASTQPVYEPSIALIRHAIGLGINFFDVGTFYCHGHCETAFGLATRHVPAEKVLICGKNSMHQTNELNWLAQLKHSLKLFERQVFDLYFLHYLTLDQWQRYFLENGAVEQINQAKEQGLIQHLGFSSHDTPANVRTLIDTNLFSAVILSYNLLRRDYEQTLDYAHSKGLGVIVMNPLAGGVLTRVNIFDHHSGGPWYRANAAQVALNYVLSQPFAHVVLSGMESLEIIDENIRTVHDGRFNLEEIASLNKGVSRQLADALIPCTACNYCLPCVQGIDIPTIIKIWNHYSILQGDRVFAREYEMMPMTAECCIQCGSCVERCPNRIDVPDIMEKASKLFS
jgi:uncharacterized protein